MSRSIFFECVFVVFSSLTVIGGAIGSDKHRETHRFLAANAVEPHDKCGFHIIAAYFSAPGDKYDIKETLQTRPSNDTSIISQSGKFRIHFDTTDANGNQPFLYDANGHRIPGSTMAFVDSVAFVCDHVYHIEVDSLGFPPPPSDMGEGGGNEYDIYIQFQDTDGTTYGYTVPDYSQPIIARANPTYAAYTVIRNEFESTYTKGIPAMEVTIAHEFHHGIQIGNYGLWQTDIWFYELTSVWMEQVVYPEVKDYYQYLPDFFRNVDLPFNNTMYAGYERCVFGIFAQNEYSNYGIAGVMEGIWQNMVHEDVIHAIEDEFKSIGVDPSYAFQLFAQWNYFTSSRSALAPEYSTGAYPLAKDYPEVKISGVENFAAGGDYFSASALGLTQHFYQVSVDIIDTIGLAVVNTNFSAAGNRDTTNYPFLVGISAGGPNCRRELTNGYCIFFSTSDDRSNWEFVPSILSSDTTGTIALKNGHAYPQPFNPSFGQPLIIPYNFAGTSNPTLSIFSVSGVLLCTLNNANALKKYFTWDGRDGEGRMVSSGIYLYVLSDGSRTVLGKIAVVRN